MKMSSLRLPLVVVFCVGLAIALAASRAGASSGATQISFLAPAHRRRATSRRPAEARTEFPGDSEDGPDPYTGNIVDRSLSGGPGNGLSVNSGKKAKSNPTFNTGFEGLNHYQQRYARGGNQFSRRAARPGPVRRQRLRRRGRQRRLQRLQRRRGQSVLPDNTATNIVGGFPRNVNHAVDLNSFYGYPPAINRSTGVRGQFVTDPTCIYDAATQRFFLVVLTLETSVPALPGRSRP